MAQQINLYRPILLAPLRIFSAQRMAWALGGLLLALALFCSMLLLWHYSAERAHQVLQNQQQQEQKQLTRSLAQAREQLDPARLTQRLQALQRDLLDLQTRAAEQGKRQLPAGQHHSTWLALLARSTPAPVWLTQMRLAPTRIEIQGLTLEPEALTPWMQLLAQSAPLPGQRWAEVQVDEADKPWPQHPLLQAPINSQGSTAGSTPGTTGITRTSNPLAAKVWRFRFASGANLPSRLDTRLDAQLDAPPASPAAPLLPMEAAR